MKSQTTRLVWLGYILVISVFIIAPLALVVAYSFSPTRYMHFPPESFSTKWYTAFFASRDFMTGLGNTLVISLITPLLCLGIALPTAHAVARRSFPGAGAVSTLMSSTLLLPGIVTGIAFLSFFNTLGLANGLARMTVAMTVFCLPFAMQAISASYHGMNREIEEAARDLGASAWYTYIRVVLPQLRPGIVAGVIFIFAETVDNFTINVFLADQSSATLPIVTYDHMRNYDDPIVAVVATFLAAIALVLMLSLSRLVGLDRSLTQMS